MRRPLNTIIVAGLALTLVVPAMGIQRLTEHLPAIPTLVGREGFWWLLFVVVLAYVRFVEKRPLSSIGYRWPAWKSALIGVGGALALVLIVGVGAQAVFDALHMTTNAQTVQTIMRTPQWYRVLLCIRAAVCEETFFRGYGIARIEALTGSSWIAGAVTLVAFSLTHLS